LVSGRAPWSWGFLDLCPGSCLPSMRVSVDVVVTVLGIRELVTVVRSVAIAVTSDNELDTGRINDLMLRHTCNISDARHPRSRVCQVKGRCNQRRRVVSCRATRQCSGHYKEVLAISTSTIGRIFTIEVFRANA